MQSESVPLYVQVDEGEVMTKQQTFNAQLSTTAVQPVPPLQSSMVQQSDKVPVSTMPGQPTAPLQIPMVRNMLGPNNTTTTCQFCGALVHTAIKHTTTTRTHLMAILCWSSCCLCCIPYCCDSCRNTDHYCPNCDRFLGTYEK